MLLFGYFFDRNTRLEIKDKRKLVSYGFNNPFSSEAVNIYDIKYIYRAKVESSGLLGNYVLFFTKDKADKLNVMKIREKAYPENTLVNLISTLKLINPNIEIDSEYMEIVDNRNHLWKMPANKSIWDVRKILEDKEENL